MEESFLQQSLTEPSWALPETLENLVCQSFELQLHQSQRPGRAAYPLQAGVVSSSDH